MKAITRRRRFGERRSERARWAEPPEAPRRQRSRRVDSAVLRWQARLDADWADRVVPWAVAVLLFAVYLGAALARHESLGSGTGLARHLQAAWALREGRAPAVTVGGDGNILSDGAPFGFLPLAALTRVLPPVPTLLGAQALALALGVVAVWRIARRVTDLRIGATAAVAAAYACHPLTGVLDLSDFQPVALAVPGLLATAYYVHQRRWVGTWVACAATVVWASELGLVVAGLGLLLLLEGERRHGVSFVAAGLAWTVVAVTLVQAPLGPTGLLGPGQFSGYGDGGLDVLIELLRNPVRPLADLVAEDRIGFVVLALAPLAFLPLVAPLRLVPALPLLVLVFASELDLTGGVGAGHNVALLTWAVVAACFGLAALGRRNVQRVNVDVRIVVLLVGAAVGSLLALSPLSPYSAPLRPSASTTGDQALREAAARIPPELAVRAPARALPLLAERDEAYALQLVPFDAPSATEGVDVVILDESGALAVGEGTRLAQRRAFEAEDFRLVSRIGGVSIFLADELSVGDLRDP